MGKIIAVANQKGGVGKTTTCLNLGIGLAKQGKKVLLVDSDSQGNLTSSLGIDEPDQLEKTIATLAEAVLDDREMSIDSVIMHHDEGIDFIPANIELSGLELLLVNAMSRENIYKQILNSLSDLYDYIFIDCMPSLGIITVNALTCADSVLIPVQPHYLSIKGLQQLFKTIGKVRRTVNRKLEIEGVLFTMVQRTNFNADCINCVIKAYGNQVPCFKTEIPASIRVAETTAEGRSIFLHNPSGKAALAYQRLVEEVMHNGDE